MNLIDIYIQEVIRLLPEKNRKDIALELRSTIEDMLPEQYSEEEVKSVLKDLGNPAILANGYNDRPMYLIGPRYYEMYITIIKIVLPIAAIVSFVSLLAHQIITFNSNGAVLNIILDIILYGIVAIIETCMHTFFWITIAFLIAERVDSTKGNDPVNFNFKKWSPEDLMDTPDLSKKRISDSEIVFSLFWTALWATCYFYADHLFGVYEKGNQGLIFVTPALDQEVLLSYWPMIIVVAILEVGLAIYKLIERKWTKKLALYNTVIQVVVTTIFIIILLNPNLLEIDFKVWAGFDEQIVKGVAIVIFITGALWNIIDSYKNVWKQSNAKKVGNL